MDMFWVVSMVLHSPWMNLDVNFGSWSLMNFNGNPNQGNMCCMINPAISSAVMASLHGMNNAASARTHFFKEI